MAQEMGGLFAELRCPSEIEQEPHTQRSFHDLLRRCNEDKLHDFLIVGNNC